MSRRRGRNSKRRGSSGRGKPFWADRLYAAWCALSVCGLGCLAAVARSLPEEELSKAREALKSAGFSQLDWNVLAGYIVLHFLFNLGIAVGLWQSRRWGFWLILGQSALMAACALMFVRKDVSPEFGSFAAPIVFALVRLNGIWGPKPR